MNAIKKRTDKESKVKTKKYYVVERHVYVFKENLI